MHSLRGALKHNVSHLNVDREANAARSGEAGASNLYPGERTGRPWLFPNISDRKSFLDSITYEFGPKDLLGAFFLEASDAVSKRGLTLVASSLDDLLDVNRANAETWLPIVSIFNSELNTISRDDSYCILGINGAGEVVATQAVRRFAWAETTLADEVQSMRLFYSDPGMKGPGEACTISAPSADRITGSVAYSGAAWYRPDYRKCGLSSIMPRIARAFAFTKWSTTKTITLMAEGIVKGGVPERVGYLNVEWEARFHNNALAGPRFALLWMDDRHLLADLASWLGRTNHPGDTRIFRDAIQPQVDPVIEKRTA